MNKRQAGRQTKRPKTDFNPNSLGLDALLRDDLLLVLRECGAPKEWEHDLNFLLGCLLIPGSVNAVKILNGTATGRIVWEESGRTYISEKASNALRFSSLFARDPDLFIRILDGMNSVVAKRMDSVEFQAAMMIANDPKSWNEKSYAVSASLRKSGLPVSPKVIEKARARLRKCRS